MKKLSIFLVMLLCISANIFAQEFSAVNSDGKTIYYNITSSTTVAVTYDYDYYENHTYYTGVINIPESVTYDGNTYSVTSIGDFAFSNCYDLTSVTIPNSVTSIGSSAFAGCSGLTSVTIGNSVTSIGNMAFYDCSGLTSVTIGNSVTSIGEWAFYNCYGLTSVTIPNSVTSIGDAAFSGCEGLTSITIPNSVTSIGFAAFESCSGLTSITIGNSVTSIGKKAFYDCSGLTSVTIPNSVTSIGSKAFYDCSGLTSVTIGNSVTSIGYYAFYGCSSITNMSIGNNNQIETIEDKAFYKCLGLTDKLTLHNIKSIGNNAFDSCINLHYVYLGQDIETIGDSAFSKLSRLDTIRVKASYPITIQANTFNGVNVATPLVVPCGRLSYYQNAEYWSNFVNMIEDCNMSDEDVSIEEVAEETGIAVYPNPVMDNAVLSIDNLKEDVKVILTDEQGRQLSLSTMKAGEREINLNTSSFANGIYFVRIVGETIQRTEKIIKK